MELQNTAQQILAAAGIHVSVRAFLTVFALIFARFVATLTLVPFLGGNSVPSQVKVGLAAILAAVLYPALAPAEVPVISPLVFVALLGKEILIGVTIGFLVQLVFYTVQMAGALMDVARGMNQMTFVAPQLPGNTSILGSLQLQAALVLFLSMDGHLLFLRGLRASFNDLPLFVIPHFDNGFAPILDRLARISADALLVAVELAAPVLIALFLIDVCFGAIGKVAPQINVYYESMPAKALLGLGMVFIISGLLLDRLIDFAGQGVAEVFTLVRSFQ